MMTTRPLLFRKSIPSDALPLRIEQDVQNHIRRSESNRMIIKIEDINMKEGHKNENQNGKEQEINHQVMKNN